MIIIIWRKEPNEGSQKNLRKKVEKNKKRTNNHNK
jgi:hypothetical protein